MDYKRKYYNLLLKYEKLEYEFLNLKRQLQSQSEQLDKAEFRLRNELEPRLRRAAKSYDNYVTGNW